MATHSSILAWKIPWREEFGTPWGHSDSDMTEHTACTQHMGLAALPRVESSDTCIGRWILRHWITKEVWDFILRMNF